MSQYISFSAEWSWICILVTAAGAWWMHRGKDPMCFREYHWTGWSCGVLQRDYKCPGNRHCPVEKQWEQESWVGRSVWEKLWALWLGVKKFHLTLQGNFLLCIRYFGAEWMWTEEKFYWCEEAKEMYGSAVLKNCYTVLAFSTSFGSLTSL